MSRSLLVAALLFAAPLATAQTTAARLWPLVPGNTWTYLLHPTSNPDRTFRWTVLDSVDVGAERLPRLLIEDLSTVSCLVRTSVFPGNPSSITYRLLDVTGAAPCPSALGTIPLNFSSMPGVSVSTSTAPEQVSIGGEALGERRVASGGEWDTNPQTIYQWKLVDQVGILNFSHSVTYTGNTSFGFSATLRHATVDGQPIGQTLASRADFWPLAAGNRWEFWVTDSANQPIGEVAWTVEAAGAGLALRMEHIRDGRVVASATCPVSVNTASPDSAWRTRFILGECALPDPALAPNLNGTATTLAIDLYTPLQTVAIGPQVAVADVASGSGSLGGGPNGSVAQTNGRFARGIGPVSYVVKNLMAPPVALILDARLAFARVGGTTYGQQVVAGEAGPDAAALALTAGPNPTRGALALAFTLPAPADAAVEVVDALGRTVLQQALGARPAGAGSTRLDLTGLAAGVYSVRLTAGEARAAARVSVVR